MAESRIIVTVNIMLWLSLICTSLITACQKKAPVEIHEAQVYPPTVTIVNPTNGQLLKSPITVEAVVRHNLKIRSVYFYLDGVNMVEDSVSPYQYRWNAGFWADGQIHRLMAKAIDSLGNSGISDTVEVTVDTSAIGIQLLNLPTGITMSSPTLITVDTVDDDRIMAVTFLVDDKTIGTDSLKPFQQFWVVGFWADGSMHSFQAVAVDSAGRNSKSSIVEVTIPLSAVIWPEPISPINNEYQESQIVRFIWNSIPSAETYKIEIREFPNSTLPVFTATAKDSFTETSTLPSSLFGWKIKAYNEQGRSTAWSPEAEFGTIVTFSKLYQTPNDGGIQSAWQISSGDYILAARMESEGITMKLNKYGDIRWQHNSSYAAKAVKETRDQGFILAGSTSSSVAQLVKLNSNGSEIFLKSFSKFRAQYFCDVVEDDDGSFFVGGSIEPDFLSRDGWLLKFTPTGDTIFTKTVVGDGDNEIQRLLPYGDNIVLAGTFRPMIDSAIYGPVVSWLRAINKTGDTLWTSEFQHKGSTYVQSIAVSPSGDILLAGSTENPNSQVSDIWLAKANSTGKLVWSKTYGGSDQDFASSVSAVKEDGYIITGVYKTSQETDFDIYVMRIDEDGNQLWFKQYALEGPDDSRTVSQTQDGGFLVGGASTVFNDGYKMRLIKTDKYGRLKFSD